MQYRVPAAVIYSDLDGTLLDHDTYRWDAAAVTLQTLADRGIPWVPVTSKTFAELLPLRRRLNHDAPFIVENGGLICVPVGYFDRDLGEEVAPGIFAQRLGTDYQRIRALLGGLRERGFAFRGFGDMDDAEVASLTGLPRAAAAAARRRLCSEPLVWEDSAEARSLFQAALADRGLRSRSGGRFLHVLAADKGEAVRRLHRRFESRGQIPIWALGDSGNDLDMLAVADRAALVARPDGSYAAPARPPELVHADGVGPCGWAAAVNGWLAEMDAKETG